MKEPVDHILRQQLPWRQGECDMTECGHNKTSVQTITRAEFQSRLKDLGQQRTAMITCMTCIDAYNRWKWHNGDHRSAVAREVEWETGGSYRMRTSGNRGQRLLDELTVIGDLVHAHREEFDERLRVLQQQRDWREKTEARKQAPRQSKQRPL